MSTDALRRVGTGPSGPAASAEPEHRHSLDGGPVFDMAKSQFEGVADASGPTLISSATPPISISTRTPRGRTPEMTASTENGSQAPILNVLFGAGRFFCQTYR